MNIDEPLKGSPYFSFRGVEESHHVLAVEEALIKDHDNAGKAIKAALDDLELDLATKNYLAGLDLTIVVSEEWGLEHFSGQRLYGLLKRINSFAFIPHLIDILLKNPNIDIKCIQQLPPHTRGDFVSRLSEPVFKKNFNNFLNCRVTLGLELPLLAARARVIFDLDESIPDEWIEKMYK